MIASKGRKVKQFAPSFPKDGTLTKRRFYALYTRGEKKPIDGYYDEGNYLHIILVI